MTKIKVNIEMMMSLIRNRMENKKRKKETS